MADFFNYKGELKHLNFYL